MNTYAREYEKKNKETVIYDGREYHYGILLFRLAGERKNETGSNFFSYLKARIETFFTSQKQL